MGLFSRHRTSTDDDVSSNSELYVLIRYTDASRSASSTTWSLAISEQTASHPCDHPHERSSESGRTKSGRTKKSFFASTSQQDSTSDAIPNPSSRALTSQPGTLREYSPVYNKRTTTGIPTSHPPLLLKILLPHTAPTKSKRKPRLPLSMQLEQTLQTTHSDDTESWLQTSLSQLQQSQHLPSPPNFHIAKFMDFARNRLAACQTGLHGDEVEVVDYAAHLAENERLRAHFGHEGTTSESSSEQGGAGQDKVKWWVSWPMAEQGDRGRDVYAGLM